LEGILREARGTPSGESGFVFDHIKPINPKVERWKKRLLIGIPLAAILSGYLYYEFKNYPEERQVSRFLKALEEQDYPAAYLIWKPSRYYTFQNFSEDWGPDGVQGPIHDFDITDSHERGSGVIVYININGNKELALWVEKGDKSLSFPP
jgi:hypothetical protein